jgi:hypothetical protein
MAGAAPTFAPGVFESTIATLDGSVRASAKRTARADREIRRVTKRARGEEAFPLHEPEDAFSAAVLAVETISKLHAPAAMTLSTNPRLVYEWFVECMIAWGEECRREGADIEREAAHPRVPPAQAQEALLLMTRLNAMLTRRAE